MYISYIVLCDIYIMKLMYVYVQTLIMLLRLGMHTKYINKNKNIVPSPCCPHCDQQEMCCALWFKCNRYAASRSDLFRVIGLTVDKLGIGITNECQINNVLLCGHTLLTYFK